MNSYELSRRWFDFCFENPEMISPNHTAIYFFAIEHCNRLGWRDKFGFPTQMAMDAIGIKKHQTYIRYFNEIVEWKFFKLIQKSLNQYSANIISLQTAMPKNGKALDKAIITHEAKQTEPIGQSNGQSNSSIDKQDNLITNNKITIEERKLKFADTLKPFKTFYNPEMMDEFYEYWTEPNKSNSKFRQELQATWDLKRRLETWVKNDKNFNKSKPESSTKTFIPPIVTAKEQ
jgi:hypothetical protein